MNNVFVNDWKSRIQSNSTGKKLRTYKLFKKDYHCEQYLSRFLPRLHRSALAKFRCGVAPLLIETGRYSGINVNERFCFNCTEEIEDEFHVLIKCPLYADLREKLFENIENTFTDFRNFNENDKFKFLLSNGDICHMVAKTCHLILLCRNSHLFMSNSF